LFLRPVDFLQDAFALRNPPVRLRISVMFFDRGTDAFFKLPHTLKTSIPDAVLRDVGKKAFCQIEPRAQGRREVHVKPEMLRRVRPSGEQVVVETT